MGYLDALLARVRERPPMVGLDSSQDAICFLIGLHVVFLGLFTDEFREWLVAKLGRLHNLSWPALILELAMEREGKSEPGPAAILAIAQEFLEISRSSAGEFPVSSKAQEAANAFLKSQNREL